MKTSAIVLVALFVAQLAAAGVLYYNSTSQRAVRPQGSLLAMDATEVNRIAIEGEGESITLSREMDSWLIESNGLPAEQSRVDSTLQALSDMKMGWAVASSDSSHQQLEVADDKFQRRVKIGDDGNTGDVFIGTSPGFKRSHVRRGGADEVYSVAINTFDLPVKASDWLDKSLLQVSDVSTVTIADKALSKQDDQWLYGGNDNTDQEKAADMIRTLEGLRVTDIATTDTDGLEFETVVLKTGDSEYEYRFASSDNDYLVARADIDSVFKLSKSSYDKVIGVELIVPEPEPVSDDQSESDVSQDSGDKPVDSDQSLQGAEPAVEKTE